MNEKFKSMVHYIISLKPGISQEEINAICWYADSKAFMETGFSISGTDYIKN